VSTDPFDEANWKWPNPALDQFKSRDAMRRQALDAKNDPAKENGFRQFQANQRVQQKFRWMPMHLYRACGGTRTTCG
jgi:phage terminase large subunit-like protein